MFLISGVIQVLYMGIWFLVSLASSSASFRPTRGNSMIFKILLGADYFVYTVYHVPKSLYIGKSRGEPFLVLGLLGVGNTENCPT